MQIPDFWGFAYFPQAMRRRCSPPAQSFHAHGLLVQPCDRAPGQMDALIAVVDGQQADASPASTLLKKTFVIFPEELSMREDAAHLHGGAVPRLRQARRIRAAASRDRPRPGCACPVPGAGAPRCIPGGSGRRRVVARAGWLQAARPWLPSGCGACARGGRSCSGWPAWIRCARMPSLIHHHRQPRQPGRRAGGEGRTVIGAHGPGQPYSRNAAFEESPAPARCRSSPPPGSAADSGSRCRRWSADRWLLHRRCAASP